MAGIFKRGSVWWGRIQIKGQDVRQSLKTTSRRTAETRFREWLEHQDQWGGKPRRTYDEGMESFLTNHCPTLRPQSQRRYWASARKLTDFFEGKYFDEITSPAMADYEAQRRAEGVSSPTIRRDLSCLSSMFTHCIVDLDWLDINPVPVFLKRQKRRGRLRESPPRRRYLDHGEEADLLAVAKGDLEDQIAFAIDTGLRLEELYSLTWGQVSLGRREVTITKEIAKSKRERTVPLLERSAQILAQLPRRLRIAGGPDWVFCKKDGSRYLRRTRGFNKAVEDAGLKDVIWHDLRRTCGCRLLQDMKARMEEVRDWHGHESIAQTERAYAFLRVDDLHALGTKTGTGRADKSEKAKGSARK